jgi:hypothetical protein
MKRKPTSWPPGTIQRLLFVLAVTLGVLVLLWFVAIAPLQDRLTQRRGQVARARIELRLAQTQAEKAPENRILAEQHRRRLAALEVSMAQGDLLRWGINRLLDYQDKHDVIFIAWDRPQLLDLDVPPAVPYRLASYSVNGQAYYHELGSFLAAFENDSPFVKINRLTIQALGPGTARKEDPERLTFQLDYLSLAKTNAPAR